DLGQRPGNAVAYRTGLAADAAAVDADADVDVALVAGDRQRLTGDRLVQGAREELLERALVDLELAVAGDQRHPGDRALALARRQVASAALHLRWRSARGLDLAVVSADKRRLAPGFLLFLGFQPRPLLSTQRGSVR